MSSSVAQAEPKRVTYRNVRALDPALGLDAITDLSVVDGNLVRVEPGSAEGTQIVEARGCFAFPALTDLRANFFDPGAEYREGLENGLRAAAAGGYFRVCCPPAPEADGEAAPVVQSMLERAARLGGVTLLPTGALTHARAGKQLAEIGSLKAVGAVATQDAPYTRANAAVLRRALEYARSFDQLVISHPVDASLAQDGVAHEGPVAIQLGLPSFPAAAEEIGLARDLALVRLTGVRYHATLLSTAGSVNSIRKAKAEGLSVTCDVSIHQLVLTEADLSDYNPGLRLFPPPRSEQDRQALLAGVRDGVIDAIVSDHCPLSPTETDCEFQDALAGATSLELVLSLAATLAARGELTWTELIRALTTGPSRVLQLPDASLASGARANLVLFDPGQRWIPSESRLVSKGRNTPFWDNPLPGRVRATYADGNPIFSA